MMIWNLELIDGGAEQGRILDDENLTAFHFL
jgi:hypothetical protein